MGLISSLLGNAGVVELDELNSRYEQLLIPDEKILIGFKVIRDTFVFTNLRLIFIDVLGFSGHRVEYKSVDYGDISRFSVESAGDLDLEADLKIWVGSEMKPSIVKKFDKDVNIYEVQKVLASQVLRKG